MASLDEELEAYAKSDYYPFHMPGHKRNREVLHGRAAADITEIEGFDDLHHAGGILKEAQERAASLYGAGRSFYLLNGSTLGILTAIFAVTRQGDSILLARNCHRSAYHAAILRELETEYIFPEADQSGINGSITSQMVEEAFSRQPKAKALILTSPTYDGVVSDIASIAEVLHRHGAFLIVDEAHGSHFGMHPDFPQTAVRQGADLVIQSLHKTLPSYTQTALLHCNRPELEKEVERHLRIFMTSSPSYLFMAGMDECIIRMKKEGYGLLEQLSRRLDDFYQRTVDLKHLHVITPEEMAERGIYAFDKSRLLLHAGAHMDGNQLQSCLHDRYHLEMEMAAGSYVIAITSLMDREEGFLRLAKALKEIDVSYPEEENAQGKADFSRKAEAGMGKNAQMSISRAFYAASESRPLEEALGQILAEFIYIYPPGIPEVVPGERLSEESLERILYWKKIGLDLQGMEDPKADHIRIVREERD